MNCRHDDDLVDLDDIVTAYEGADRPALNNINIRIGKGEYVIVGGVNGAGKTTLIESVIGMLPIIQGTARVCGLDVRKQGNLIRKRVGYVIQNFFFDPLVPFTVKEVVMMGRYGKLGYFRRPDVHDIDLAEHAMATLEVDEFAEKTIGTLSGGQQQKVLIAQNLAKEPDLLLLDEPFSNLDIHAREHVSEILSDLVETGVTVVVVSHAFDGLPERMIRAVVMDNGRITLDHHCNADELEEIIRTASSRPAIHA